MQLRGENMQLVWAALFYKAKPPVLTACAASSMSCLTNPVLSADQKKVLLGTKPIHIMYTCWCALFPVCCNFYTSSNTGRKKVVLGTQAIHISMR
jgi:hypothetical protein